MEASTVVYIVTITLLIAGLILLMCVIVYLRRRQARELEIAAQQYLSSQEYQSLLRRLEELAVVQGERDRLLTELEHIRYRSIQEWRDSDEYKRLLAEYGAAQLEIYRDSHEYQRLLEASRAYEKCEQMLQSERSAWERKHEEQRRALNQLQQEFDYERRYKNVSNIGEQLRSAIINRLTENFSMSGLVHIIETPEMRRVPNKRHRSIRTDILVDVYSPLDPSIRVLRVVIEAKNQRADTIETQKNRKYYDQICEQLEAYEADYALMVSELEPENHALTIVPIEHRDNVFILRFSYLVGLMQVLIRFALKNQYYIQKTRELKSRELLMRVIDEGTEEIEQRQFRFINDRNKQIRDKCENIKGILDDIDDLTHKNDRRLRISSTKLLNFYQVVRRDVEKLPQQGESNVPLLESNTNDEELSEEE